MKTFKNILSLIKLKEKITLSFILLLISISSFLEMVGIGLILPFLNLIVDQTHYQNNQYLKSFLLYFNIENKNILILVILSFIILANLIKSIVLTITAFVQAKSISKIHIRITNEMYFKYIKSPWEYMMNKNSATLLRDIHSSTHEFTSKLLTGILFVISEVLMIIFISSMLIVIEPIISIISIIFLILMGAITQGLTRKYNYTFGIIRQKNLKLINKHLIETFRSFKLIKVLNKENIFSNIYKKISSDEIFSKANQEIFQKLPRIWIEFFAVLVISFLLIYGASYSDNLSSFIPTIGIFVVSAYKLLPSLNKILNILQSLRFATPALENLIEENLDFKKNKEYLVERDKKSQPITFENKISFKNISFKYKSSNQEIFNNFNFEITKNSTLGIVGKSGSGKSTLIDILMGILKPDNGEILIDDTDLNKIKKSWQKKTGYVPQETYLFDDSIKNNIAFGIQDSLIDKDKIYGIINDTGLNKIIDNLPNKIDSYVGDNGAKLSGGQKQRLGLARALYISPEILILDEATSALDFETEAKILNLLNKYKNKITIIIISHRETILPYCDKILDLNKI